ncbi:uncharacterized protein [Montipora foliosa]|uniref:uncharacterized protein n=1 Tax=Montipora foliosa TaxID=591990 RepID=UPI0035F1700C
MGANVLNSYFVANNVGQVAADASDAAKRETDKRKVAVTISLIGKQTYSTLKDLCLPNLPAEKTYDQLTELLNGYYKPKVLEVAESYRFRHTLQSENETVTEYANKLKRLAVNCNSGTYLTTALRNQFEGGVKSQDTKRKLLSEDGTFEQADELAEKESKQLQSNCNLSAKVTRLCQRNLVQHTHPTPNPPLNKLSVTVDNKEIPMDIDTGSAVTLLSATDFSKLGGHIETLKNPTVILKSYTGNIIECLGEKEMEFKIGDQLRRLTYPNLFDNTTVGKLKGIQVSLRVKEANPVFIKPRVVPFALRSKYEEALEKLVAEDIIEKVEHSEWVSPTVPIVKPNGDLRICGDYSVTVNKFSVMEQYPIPSLEELRLLECGLKLNSNKFHFMLDQVLHLGTTISAGGISPTKERVKAIRDAEAPANVSELKSFLGSANFPRKFVPDFARIASPLYQLLRKETPWKGGKLEPEAFNNLKATLCCDSVPRQYDSTSKLILQCDASSVGVGATLLQPGPDHSLLPVANASRILTSAEQNYSQIERESLAIVFGVTKF